MKHDNELERLRHQLRRADSLALAVLELLDADVNAMGDHIADVRQAVVNYELGKRDEQEAKG